MQFTADTFSNRCRQSELSTNSTLVQSIPSSVYSCKEKGHEEHELQNGQCNAKILQENVHQRQAKTACKKKKR